jgi:DNA-binding transcriptional LysR family regulator
MRAITGRGEAGELVAVPIAEPHFTTATIDLIVLRERRVPRVLQAFIEALTREFASMAPAAR